jgi:hypothetical protein
VIGQAALLTRESRGDIVVGKESSMKYLCLCYYDQKKFNALSESDLEALGRACRPHDQALHESSHLLLVGSLAPPSSSRALRPGNGRPSVTDGPYAETREPVGAFLIIEARDMGEAVEVASKHPGAHVGDYLGGGIEVRPIDMLDHPGLQARS